jgi:hydrogenase maturation protease
LDEKYEFKSNEHTIDLIDGGTLAQRLIPIITDYDKVVICDCVSAVDGSIGDVFFFDFTDVPEAVTWEGSAHEVEMLQTLQMIEMAGDLPETKIVGVVPYVIGENSTFDMTDEVLQASKVMEKAVLDYLKQNGVEVVLKNPDANLQEIARGSYLRGVNR